MIATPHAELEMDKLNAFVGRFVTDLGAAAHTGMAVIGEKLGLYKALAAGPMSSTELAERTQTDERYVREWLASQAAGRYITYDDATNTFSLGAQAGEPRMGQVARSAGFSRFRRAAQTPFNIVYEVRP